MNFASGMAVLAIAISQVAPVYNRIPGASREGLNLTVTVRFENPTNRPLVVALERGFASFDSSKQGEEIKSLSLIDYRVCGAPPNNQCKQFTLPAGARADGVNVFSRGVAPDGHENETIFVTLIFRVGEDRVTVRGSGQVQSVD